MAKFRKNKKVRSIQKTLLSVLLGILLLVFVGFLINTNLKAKHRRTELLSQIKTLESEIKTLEEKKEEMEEKISQATSKEYLEEVARDQLGLQLSGEEVVVVKKEKEEEKKEEKKEEEEEGFWNPEKWWDWIIGK
jgi:cell division protein FtsL